MYREFEISLMGTQTCMEITSRRSTPFLLLWWRGLSVALPSFQTTEEGGTWEGGRWFSGGQRTNVSPAKKLNLKQARCAHARARVSPGGMARGSGELRSCAADLVSFHFPLRGCKGGCNFQNTAKNSSTNCFPCLPIYIKQHKISEGTLQRKTPFFFFFCIFCNNIKAAVMTRSLVVQSFIYNLTTAYIT